MLKPPSNSYSNFYDQARLELTWRVSAAIFASMVIFVVALGFLAPNYMPPSLFALAMAFIFILTLKKTGRYEIVAKSFIIIGALLSISQLIFISNILHFVDLIWFFVIILFSYFTMGIRWGIPTLLVFVAAICIFILFFLDQNIHQVIPLSYPIILSLVINTILASSILGFIIGQFIKTTRHVEVKYNNTNQKLKEQYSVIQSKNEENEMMLKEIHHRVKNNLQVITSLLRLQSRDLKSEEAKEHYNDAINRIATMSLIHEKMYQNDLAKLDLNNYFSALSEDLLKSYSSENLVIELEIDIRIPFIGLKTIIPLALLYNELMSNSLKHAFAEKKTGKIIFIGEQKDKDNLLFTYQDSGTWKEIESENSFGIELIDAFTEQLEGSFKRTTESGTKYVFRVKNID